MPAVVKCDDAAAVFGQGLHPLGEHPVYRVGRGETVNEHNRFAPVFCEGLEIRIGNLYAIRDESFHRKSCVTLF